MRGSIAPLVGALVVGLAAPAAVAAPPSPGSTVEEGRSILVSGAGVEMWPAFTPGTTRYAVSTTSGTDGELTVDATAPDGEVLVDGTRATGPVTVSGLAPGDEVSVQVEDGAGVTSYALVYLPPGFPRLAVALDGPGVSDGEVLLTADTFAMAVDRNGVPVQVHDYGAAVADLRPAPGGHFSVMRLVGGVNNGAEGDWELVELDEQFREVGVHRTVGLDNTDSHDSILRADGSRVLVAYERDPVTNRIDPVIQEVGPDGDVVYTWDGAEHLDPAAESTAGDVADWAHINSIQQLPGGDVLASFRHLSAVLRIAWSDRPDEGVERGDVLWRLGGRLNDFDFVGDPHGGPCAQHTATLLADGHLLVFDNGSAALGNNPSYCVDPEDRTGPTVGRPSTRVVEYALDQEARTATLVRSYQPGRFSYFAGSARRLPGGNTLVDWASYQGALVTELGPDDTPVWELRSAEPSERFVWSYRAEKVDVPDATPPTVSVELPDGAAYDVGDPVTPVLRCTDRGGSTLQSCVADGLSTATRGTRWVSVTAVDGDGNTTVERAAYQVTSPRPEAQVRTPSGWRHGARMVLPSRRGGTTQAVLRLENRSVRSGRLPVSGTGGGGPLGVRYEHDGRDVTRAVTSGSWRTPALEPGGVTRLRVEVVRRTAGAVEDRALEVVAGAPGVPGLTRTVHLRVTD